MAHQATRRQRATTGINSEFNNVGGEKKKHAPHCTAVGLCHAYREKHEQCTALDGKRDEQLNVYGFFIFYFFSFVQIVHVLDVYIVVCMLRSTT